MKLTIKQLTEKSGKSRNAIYNALKKNPPRLIRDEDGKIDEDDPLTVQFIGSQYMSDAQPNKGIKLDSPISEEVAKEKLSRAELENERLSQQILQLKLKNAIQVGDAVSRSLVKSRFIDPVDDLFIRLISDLPKTVVSTVKTSIASGDTDGKSEMKVKRILERTLRLTKEKLKRGFDN